MKSNQAYCKYLSNRLDEIFTQDDKVIILGEDIIDPYGGAFKITQGLSSKFPDRVLSTPICEATITGIGAGLALRGYRAIVEIMFGDFLTIAADQIINHAAKFCQMYAGRVSVPLVIRTPVGAGRGYGPTHSQSLCKIFLGIPELVVMAPSHFHDPGEELHKAVYDDRPVLFIENKLLYSREVVLDSKTLTIDLIKSDINTTAVVKNYSGEIVPDIVIITYGGISRFLEEILEEFAEEEIWCKAILPSCISSPAMDVIEDAAAEAGRVLIIEEGHIGFGWSAEISHRVYSRLYKELKAPIICLGTDQTVIPASFDLEENCIINKDKIENAIMEVLR